MLIHYFLCIYIEQQNEDTSSYFTKQCKDCLRKELFKLSLLVFFLILINSIIS